MSKPLAFGLNFTKKTGASKPPPPKRKPMFGGDSDDDDDKNDGATNGASKVEEIGGDLDDFVTTAASSSTSDPSRKTKPGPKSATGTTAPTQPPKMKPSKSQPNAMFGDLSSSLTSRKNAEAASELDASVYEYDAVYDSLKPKKPETKEDKDRRPKYMRGLMEAADVRKRDALIAEEKKIAREREAEGDEYEGKEKFVTEAYRKQQEENKKLEEEERQREEKEAKKNQTGGMSGFYRNLLNKEEQRNAEAVKAAEEAAKDGAGASGAADGKGPVPEEQDEGQRETKRVKELNEKGADIAINDEGQVVDKRQLLKGGLNLGAKRKDSKPKQDDDGRGPAERERRPMSGQQVGSRQAQRERQSRMMAEQLEQSMKRNREEAEAQREEAERAAKSRKTEGEISSAKERYLARKKAAEEEKKKAAAAAE